MPSITISLAQLQATLLSDTKQITLSTPLGNTILEIQGDLEIPLQPQDDSRFSKHNDEDIVRFGLLSIGPDGKDATLFVGKKQRLLGSVVKLDTPLGLLKFDEKTGAVEMQDIFNYKVIFKNRPLPIM